jgi:hypothetical protein
MGEKDGSPENIVLNPLRELQFATHANAKAEAFFSTLKTECFPSNQVFATKAEARRELFEYIEVYYNNQRLHSALGYETPSQYETKFNRVIDTRIDTWQSIDAVPEDRALRGRTSSADAAACKRRAWLPTGSPPTQRRHLPEQAKSVKSQGVRGTESPDSPNNTLKKTENQVSVFSGEVHFG